MKRFLLLVTSLFLFFFSNSQDFSNKGKDFWVGYGYHQIMVGNNAQDMVLYFATESITNITVSIPGVGYTQTFSNIAANTIFETPPLPKTGTQDARLLTEQMYNRGIHITADKPIVAYAHIYNASVSGATLLFPTPTLGKEYYSVNYKNWSNSANANCWFYVIAADSGTTAVEITPTAATLNHPANVTFTVNLTQGQIYNVMGTLTQNGTGTSPYIGVDLTGSKVKSVSVGENGCKRIGVFSGSGRISITCNNNNASSDNYMVQAFPKSAWGKQYLTVPTGGNMTHNIFRICVLDPATVVKFNGNILVGPPTNNFYYEVANINVPSSILSDKPIMVAQYITSQGACGNGSPGDPEVIYLSPTEQNINKVIFNSTTHFAITQHFVNVVIPNTGTGVSSFRLDNAPPSSSFTVHPQNPSYLYLQQALSAGQHTIRSDSGFNAIAYGYGSAESYGYNAGSNVKDLYQFIGIINPYGIVEQPSACANTPFFFSLTLPYQPLSLAWDFHGFQTPNVVQTYPIADTTYFVNGKQVWRYKLPNSYIYTSGVYPVTVIANNPTPEGCSGEQVIDFDLNVYTPPVAKFNYINNGCLTDSVRFQDSTNYAVGTFSYKWYWNFGDGSFDSVHNPIHLYSAPGTYTVKFSLISNVGCLSDTAVKQITVTLVPNAKFDISSPVCSGAPITLYDSSIVYAPGILAKWYWDYGDGIRDTVLNNSNRVHIYSPYGNKTTSLKVETTRGCTSPLFIKSFYVNPIPVPDFLLPAGICLLADSAHFLDASTIADNTQSGFIYLWHFGDLPSGANDSSVLRNPAHFYTTGGPFSINLKVTSAAGCFHDTTKILGNVYQQVHSAFSATPENCLNDSTFFTDHTVTPVNNAIATWFWDFGDGQASSVQNPAHVYSTAGSYVIKFYIKTVNGCTSDTSTQIVLIDQLPTAKFGFTSPDCVTKAVTFSDSSVANSGIITAWKWNMGDGTILNLTNNNPFTHAYATAGTYLVTLTVTTDKGCKSAILTKQVIIHSNPVPFFSMSGVCLPSGFAQFTDLSTIADSTQALFSYVWDFGDPGSGAANASTLQNPTHNYSSTGPFDVKLTVTSNAGCVKDTTSQLTQIYAQPHAVFSVNSQNCLNDSTHFTDQSVATGGVVNEWHWNFGDGQTSLVQNPVHLYSATGSYTVTLYIKTDKGCISDTATKVITVNPLPTAKFGFSAPDCVGTSVTFSDSSLANAGNITLWNWDLGDGTLLNLNNGNPFTHIYSITGNVTIKLTVTSSTGCVSLTLQKQLIIHASPIPDFIASTVCLPDGIAQFTNQSTISDGTQAGLIYAWDFGEPSSGALNISSLQNPQHHYSTAGPFNVKLTVTSVNGCVKDTTKQITEIYAQPHANFSFTLNSQSCLSDSTHFLDQSNGFGGMVNEWHWTFGDGQIATVKNPVHLYASPGTYTVSLHVKTDKGCLSDTMVKQVTITPLPQANFGFSVPDCLGNTITFSDSSLANGGSITTWNWDLGDGTLLTLNNGNPFTHLYASLGSFVVTLKVTTNNGCTSLIFTKTIIVHPFPVPDFTMTPVCLPNGISQFTDQSTIPDGTQGSFTYVWDFGEPISGLSNNSTLRNPSHRYSSVGPFNIKLTVTSANGCFKDTTKTLSLIYPQPHAFISVPAENCLNDTTYFQDSSRAPGNAIVEWHWSFGDGQVSTVQNPTHVYATAGTYTVTLYIKTDKGCVSDTTTKSVIINLLPTASFTVSAPACETKTVTLTSTSTSNSGSIILWNWDLGDGTILALNSSLPFTHVYATAGTFIVKLSVQSSKGCNSSISQRNVVIHPQPVPDFITPGVCLSDAFAQFFDSSYIADGSAAAFTYLWNFGDPGSGALNTSTIRNGTHRYLAAGVYTVTLTVTSNNSCTAVKTKLLSVNGTVPKAAFTVINPAGLCSNTSVQIQDSSHVVDFGNITKIEIYWDFANNPGVFVTILNPSLYQIYSHLYPNFQSPLSKVYTIRLRAFSGGTCVDQHTSNVTINATPKVQFNFIPDTCFNASSFQLTQASEIGGVPGAGVYTGSGVSSGGIFNPATAGVGLHVIRFTFTSNKGCVDFKEQTITVSEPPIAKFGYLMPACKTQDITFVDSSTSTAGAINKWTWDFGDGSAVVVRSSGAPFTHTFPTAITYNVVLTVTTNGGCNSSVYSAPVKVNPLPVPDFRMPKVCLPNASTTFMDSSTIADGTQSAFTYLWDFGDPSSGINNSSTAKNPNHVYSAAGPYAVKLTVTSGNGCSRDTTKSFNDIHPQPLAKFKSDVPTVCANGNIAFTDLSDGRDGTLLQWHWVFGDGGSDVNNSPTHQFNTPGSYTVKLFIVNSQGCTSDTFTQGVTIYSNPVIVLNSPRSVLEGGSLTFDPTVTGNQLQYLWSPPANLSSINIKNPVVTGGPQDQTYTLKVTGQGGCTKSATVVLKVLRFPVVPNTFTPNGDGINDLWVIEHLDTYPDCRIQVFNRYGQLVYESRGYSKPWDGTMNGKLLPWGTYYYVIEPGSGRKPVTGYVTIIK